MKCDYCDSKFKEMPEDQVCPNCGGIIPTLEERRARLRFPNPPIGKYVGHNGSIQIEDDYLVIHRMHLGVSYRIEIRYCDLVSVDMISAGEYSCGFLCVRDERMQYYPIPKDHYEAFADVTCITFYSPANDVFMRVVSFLKKCVDLTKELNSIREGETLHGRFYGDDGYIELSSEYLTICKIRSNKESYTQVLEYEKIAEVAYKQETFFSRGGLAIRLHGEKKNMTDTVRCPMFDNSSISVRPFHHEIFDKIYQYIQKKIKDTN